MFLLRKGNWWIKMIRYGIKYIDHNTDEELWFGTMGFDEKLQTIRTFGAEYPVFPFLAEHLEYFVALAKERLPKHHDLHELVIYAFDEDDMQLYEVVDVVKEEVNIDKLMNKLCNGN